MKYLSILLLLFTSAQAQVSRVWIPDNNNATYKNPIIHADYSDPDATRVGEDFYMTASSFNAIPGLPILHSKDLVNWQLIGYALKRQPPYDHFSKPQHGNGVWAPSIRYHNGEFYLYYTVCKNADKGFAENAQQLTKLQGTTIYFRVSIQPGAICSFQYSNDGQNFITAGEPFTAQPGRWIGAKLGFFCTRLVTTNDAGFADIDWLHFN